MDQKLVCVVTIHGIGFQPVINNQGTIAFNAIIDTNIGPANPPGNETGLGVHGGCVRAMLHRGAPSSLATGGRARPLRPVFHDQPGHPPDLGDVVRDDDQPACDGD